LFLCLLDLRQCKQGIQKKQQFFFPKEMLKPEDKSSRISYALPAHKVKGENDFPKPIAGYEGPILGTEQAKQSVSDLITSILLPSHKISKDLEERLRTTTSPMTDYSDAITIRQLVDVVAYIRSKK
jgi:hypothetical protein